MGIYKLKDKSPHIASEAFIHSTATVIGDVYVGKHCFVAPGAVLRGDLGKISLGDRSNVQDYVTIQSNAHDELKIGTNVNLGHGAIICSLRIEDYVSVGMRAILGHGSVIGRGAMVGDVCLVLPGQEIPSETLVIGRPAKVIRQIEKDDPAKVLINRFVDWYAKASYIYRSKQVQDSE
ncbi:MAG: gamma carbonic anhydrase family protein [Candidatus Hodarchaeota archaeon]